ncbi:MAG: hypothetical protein KDA96_25180, partial [Planctomycetaceae bacterium]|nr:hypothetical protein [Planctomycetaceae bacterium]
MNRCGREGFLILIAVALQVNARHANGDDGAALHSIFAEQHVSESALADHWYAESLDPDARYQWLSERLLPTPGRPVLRIQAA